MQLNQKKYLILGFILGFIFFIIMDRGEKRKPLFFNSIIITYMNKKYHMHHWIIFSILLIILLYLLTFHYKYTNFSALLLGICIGSILQGLTYNDAFDIII